MNMAMAAAILLSLLLCTVAAVHAADHAVGGSSGWTQMVNYTAWAAGEKFSVGDNLVFTYGPSHDVAEVDRDDYDDCEASSSNPPQTGGRTVIPLTAPGTRYFICSVATHCSSGGMKVAVAVQGGSPGGSPPSSGAPPSGTTPPATTPPAFPNTPPPAPSGGGAAGSFGSLNSSLVGFSLILATLFAFMG